MDSTNPSSARQVRLPLKDAERVLTAAAFVRFAEAEPKLALWQPEDTAAALAEAERQVGESADRGKTILAVADIIAARAAESAESKALLNRISKVTLPVKAFSTFSAGIIFAAFVLGAAADQWATNGRFINLLAFPTLGVILWNVLVYVWLFVGRFVQLRFFGGLRALLLKWTRDGLSLRVKHLQSKLLGKTSGSGSAVAAIELCIRQQLRMLEPVLMKKAAFTLHFAAAAFALGLIASITVRGFSTAYVVGWESTWLADNPDLVAHVIDFFYSWLPDLFFGPHDLTGQTIASMNLANFSNHEAWRLTGLSSSLSAAWLLRMIGAIIFAVILPRLLLGLWNAFSAEHALGAVAIPADPFAFSRGSALQDNDHAAASPTAKFSQPVDMNDALWVVLADQSINSELLAHKELNGLSPAAQALAARGVTAVMTLPINVWEDPVKIRERLTDAINKLSDEKPDILAKIAQNRRLALWISAATTPEDDVHGEFLATIRPLESFGPFVILADTASLAKRFALQSETIKSKMRLWRQFAEAHGTEIRFVPDNTEPR